MQLGPFTVCVIDGDMLPVKFESPLYSAVIVWTPGISDDIAHCVLPDISAMPVHPAMSVPPSLKVTVPVGALGNSLSLTVAVKVTDCPKTEGFSEDITFVVVAGTNSYAPISQCGPCGRIMPRWSTPPAP